MINEIDNREAGLKQFMDAQATAAKNRAAIDGITNNPELKYRKLEAERKKGVSTCLDTILGKVYKDALPYDDPHRNCSDSTAADEIRDYISRRTDGKDSEYYIREAIKRNNSNLLKNMLTEAQRMSKKFYEEKVKDIGTISMKDLNFKLNTDDDELCKITKKLELDEIRDIIHNNVQKAIQDESDKSKREEEYTQQIEDSLAADPTVNDEESMEAAIAKMESANMPRIYQPSIFEAIMLGKTRIMTEAAGKDVFFEAVREYTKLNITKALMLEKFSLQDLRNLADSYL